MRRNFAFAFATLVVVATLAFAKDNIPSQPVFVYLQAHVSDHVNLDITEDRLRHLLPMLAKFREAHPGAHVSATILLSGAASEALAERNQQTHIVDFVKTYLQRGIIEIGYDGADEPTYATRPVLDFTGAKTVEDRWHVREGAIEKLMLEGRNPLTGSLIPGKDGGLKKVQEVFGSVAYVSGLTPNMSTHPNSSGYVPGGQAKAAETDAASRPKIPVLMVFPEMGADSEIVYEVHRYNDQAVMPGLPKDNPAHIPGFGGSEDGFMQLISPAGDTSPEIYWQDNVLRVSEVSNTSEEAAESEHDYHGPTAKDLKEDFGELKRSHVQVVRIELADERFYLQHSLTKGDDYVLKYAYAHPDNPKLPDDARADAKTVDDFYASEAEALDWLATDFFSANAGSRFVSNADLQKMTAPATGFSVSMTGLRAAVADVLQKWGNDTYPPTFLEVEGHYLSLADTFQVLTDAFAEFDRTGKFPESVRLVAVWGPEHTPTSHGPNVGEVTIADIAHAAAALSPRLHDASSGDVPKNSIPIAVTLIGTPVNSAQFLRLMMTALVTPSPDTKLRIRMTYMHPGQAALMPKTRIMTEMGASWTIKPAQLQISGDPPAEQAKR